MYRLRGVLLGSEGERETDLYVDAAGVLTAEPVPGAETLTDSGWIVPGLVDAHCHVGLGPDGAVTWRRPTRRRAPTATPAPC